MKRPYRHKTTDICPNCKQTGALYSGRYFGYNIMCKNCGWHDLLDEEIERQTYTDAYPKFNYQGR